MIWVHVCLDLEHETAHLVVRGLNRTIHRQDWAWRWSMLCERHHELANAEVLQRRTEEDRSEVTLAVSRRIEARETSAHELDVLIEFRLLFSGYSCAAGFGAAATVGKRHESVGIKGENAA